MSDMGRAWSYRMCGNGFHFMGIFKVKDWEAWRRGYGRNNQVYASSTILEIHHLEKIYVTFNLLGRSNVTVSCHCQLFTMDSAELCMVAMQWIVTVCCIVTMVVENPLFYYNCPYNGSRIHNSSCMLYSSHDSGKPIVLLQLPIQWV